MANDNSTTAAIAGAAASAAGQIAVDAAANKKQWKYQQRAMDKQQQLNLEAWNLQNQYNTPLEQMKRLQEAGLNPRLIYGEGSSAPNSAGPLDAPAAPTREALRPNIDKMLMYYQIRQMDAQYEATKQSTEVMRRSAGLKEIEQGLKNLELMREGFRAKDAKIHAMLETDTKTWLAGRARFLKENEQQKGFLLDQAYELRQKQMTALELDNAFKQHRNELAKLGIYQSDHPAFRVLIQAARRMNVDLGDLLKEGASNLKYLLDLKQ